MALIRNSLTGEGESISLTNFRFMIKQFEDKSAVPRENTIGVDFPDRKSEPHPMKIPVYAFQN